MSEVRQIALLGTLCAAFYLLSDVRSDAGWSRSAIDALGATSFGYFVKIKKDDDDDDDNDDYDDKEKKKKTGNICQGEIACPPGYVVLDKPNKYGACCEPKEGFPEPKKECPGGMIGTPPNDCHCPEGSEFLGHKGCVKYTTKQYCNDLDSTGLDAFANTCKSTYFGTPSCATFNTDPPHGSYRCCCYYRMYEK